MKQWLAYMIFWILIIWLFLALGCSSFEQPPWEIRREIRLIDMNLGYPLVIEDLSPAPSKTPQNRLYGTQAPKEDDYSLSDRI